MYDIRAGAVARAVTDIGRDALWRGGGYRELGSGKKILDHSQREVANHKAKQAEAAQA